MGCLNIADLKGFEVIVMLCLSGLAKKLGLSKQKKRSVILDLSGFIKFSDTRISIVVTLTFGMQCSPCGNGTYLQIVPRLHETGVFLSKLDFFKKKELSRQKSR